MVSPEILVVDDEADIRDCFRQALELQGYPVATATNGQEAWLALHARPIPALVLLDLMMPVMNGAELLRLIRSDPELEGLPVVLVTAFGALANAALANAQECVGKPLELDALYRLVERYAGPASA